MKRNLQLFFILFILTGALSVNAQSTKGKDFWFGFMDQLGAAPELKVYITSDVATSGTISIPKQSWSQNFTVVPGVSTVITVPIAQGWTQVDNAIIGKGIHLWTTECVNVFALNYYAYTADATVVLPTDAIESDYYVLTGSENSNINGVTELLVVAKENNTQVNINPSVAATGHGAGTTYTVTLDSGDVYQVKANANDLTGSHVWGANGKDFAVFAGNVCTNYGGCTACDHLFEQMFPVSAWDTAYVTVPLKTRANDLIKVLSKTAGTQVFRNGTLIATLNAGQSFQYSSSTSDYIRATNPIAMAQFSIGGSCDNQNGDPFYIVLSPLSRSLRSITFNAFQSAVITNYYLNITVKTSCLSTVTLDGALVPAASFTTVASNPTYSTAQLDITQGDHTVSSPCGIVATVYGYGSFESYGYSAGSNIIIPYTVKFSPDTSICPGQLVHFTASGDTTGLLYKAWNFGDGTPPVIGQANASHVFNNFGKFTVQFIFEQQRACKRDTVTGIVDVSDSLVFIVGDTFLCRPQQIQLKALIPPKYGSGTAILWNTGQTDSVILTTPTKDSTYSVHVNYFGCSGDKLHTVKVQNDTAKFTAGVVCLGDTTKFTNFSKVDTNDKTYTWAWDFGDGNTLNTASAVHVYTNGGTYNVTLTFTNPLKGCTETKTIPITVDAKPNTAFTTSTACLGDSIVFTNGTTITPVTTLTYDWDFGDGTTHSAVTSPKHKYATAGTYTVILRASTPSGCTDTAIRTVTVLKRFPPNFSAPSVCMPDSVNLTNLTDTTNGGYGIAWNWKLGDGNTTSAFQANYKYATGGSYTVTLTANSGGCIDSIRKTVRVNNKPVANFSIANVCSGTAAQIVNSSSISSGTLTYDYDFGDGTAHSNLAAPSHVYATAGTYTVFLTLTSDSGCVDTASRSVSMFKRYAANFTATKVCEQDSTVFLNTTDTTGNVALAWTWTYGDASTASVYQQNHLYATGGNYAVNLKVVSAQGCRDSITKNIRVNYQPHANFTLNTICQNDTLFVNNLSTLGGGTMAYNWNFGDGFSTTTNPAKHKYLNFGDYTVSVTLTSDSGCVDTMSRAVHVGKNNVLAFSSTPVCEGNTTSFVNTTDSTGSGGVNWLWNFGDNATNTSYSTTHTYAAGGTYSVLLKATTVDGCIDTLRKNARVNYQPHANFTLNNVCQNDTLFVNNLSTLGGGSMAYNWNFGDGFSTTTNPAKHKYVNYGNYTVSVTLTSDSGCVDTMSRAVHVGKNNVLAFSSTPVCEGNTTSFVNTTDSTGSGGVNWLWNFGDNATNTSYSTTHTYAAGGTYYVLLTATTTDGCIDTLRKNARVNYQPHANFTLNTICQNDTLFVNDISTLGGGTMAYNWNFGDGFSTTTNPAKHKYLNFGNYTVSVTLTSDSGCVDTLSRAVHVGKNNSLAFSATTVCEGNATSFVNTTDSTGSGGVNWLWSFGDNSTNTAYSTTHTYTPGGTYSVLLTATTIDGCIDTLRKTAQVNYQPHPDFTFTDACMGNANSFTNTTSVNGGSFSNSWTFGDGATSTVLSPSHVYSSFGSFSVLLVTTADSGCVDSIRKTVSVFEVPIANYRADSVCLGETTNFQNQTNTGTFVVQSWNWNLGDGTTDNAISPNHVYANAGIYTTSLIVITTNGCSDTMAKTVKVNALPDASAVVVEERCYNTLDGSITLTPTAGQTPFTYYWNSVVGTNTLNNIGAGHYTVIYQDANECVGTQTFDLNAKNEIFIEATALDVKCFNEQNGFINIFAYGGESGFNYLWNTGATTPTLTNITAGIYDITVTDAAGCSLDTSITINEPLPLVLNILPQDTLYIGNTTLLEVNYVTNYNNPSFTWSPSVGLSCNDCESPIASPFNTTTYEVTMTDSTGCQVKDQITIYVKANHPLYVPNAFSPNGDGNNDYFNAFTANYRDFQHAHF
jgi:PKD repeat protein